MRTIQFSPVMRALAVCIGTLAFASGSYAAGAVGGRDHWRRGVSYTPAGRKTKKPVRGTGFLRNAAARAAGPGGLSSGGC